MKKIKKLFISIMALLGFVMVGMQNVDAATEYPVIINGTTTSTRNKTVDVYSGSTKTGSVTVNHHDVEKGEDLVVTLTPVSSNYELSQLQIGSTDVTDKVTKGKTNYTYTVSNVKANVEITAAFTAKKTVNINGTKMTSTKKYLDIANGRVTVDRYVIGKGENLQITLAPSTDCELEQLMIGNTDVTANVVNNAYTLTNITEDVAITVTFAHKKTVKVNETTTTSTNKEVKVYASTTQTGIVTVDKHVVEKGGNLKITLVPNEDYELGTLKIGNNDVTANVKNNVYTLENVQENVVINVTYVLKHTVKTGNGIFTKNNKTIAVEHGTVTVDKHLVGTGEDLVITLAPQFGYRVTEFYINDGKDLVKDLVDLTYTLTNVTDTVNINVTYEPLPFVLKSNCPEGVEVTPADMITKDGYTVYFGEEPEITIDAKPGYHLTKIYVDGTDRLADFVEGKLTLPAITDDVIINIEAEADQYEVTKGDGQKTQYGKDLFFTFNGDLPLVDYVLLDGKKIGEAECELTRGSTNVKLYAKTIANLKNGNHILTVVYKNGNSAEAEFTVNNTNPETSDNIVSYITIGSVSLITVLAAGLYLNKKRSYN